MTLALVASGLVSVSACADSQQAVHVSPPSWWVGMKEQNLQLLLNYPDISNYTASTDAEHVTIQDTNKHAKPTLNTVNGTV